MIQRCHKESGPVLTAQNPQAHWLGSQALLLRTSGFLNDCCSLRYWAVEGQTPGSSKISGKLQFSHLSHPFFHVTAETTERKACLSSSLGRKQCVNPCLFMMPAIMPDAPEGVRVRMSFRQWSVWVPRPLQASPLSGHAQREESSRLQKMSIFTLWLSGTRPPLMPSLPFVPIALLHQSGLGMGILASCLCGFAFEMLLVLMAVRAIGAHSLKYHWTGT